MTEYKYPEYPILIVDDEENALESFEITLDSCGIENNRALQGQQGSTKSS